MSLLVSHTRLSPHGKNEECSKFVISDIREEFTIFGVMTPGEKYTLSFWVCSDAAGTLIVDTRTITTSSEWKKHVVQVTASSEDLVFNFEAPTTYYIYHPKLETGTLSTDWTPAPEDHEKLVSDTANDLNQTINDTAKDLNQTINEKADSVLNSCETLVNDTATGLNKVIKDTADSVITSCEDMVDYATKDLITNVEFASYKEVVESRFTIEKDNISMEFYAEVSSATSAVEDRLNGKFTELYKYITFDEKGITIGSADNAITLQLDNNGIVFRKNGVAFGLWDGTDFYTGNIVVEVQKRAQLGNFAFLPRSDGSLSFLKVGG